MTVINPLDSSNEPGFRWPIIIRARPRCGVGQGWEGHHSVSKASSSGIAAGARYVDTSSRRGLVIDAMVVGANIVIPAFERR